MAQWKNSTLTMPFFYNGTSQLKSVEDTLPYMDISDETRQLIEQISGLYMSVIVSVFGILGNSINMVVFCKQGLYSSININFTLLALSDICSLTTLLWFNICGSPGMIEVDTVFYFEDVKQLTGGFPHGCFTRISAWITVWIMIERCLCVAFPLNIKRLVTPKTTTIIIASIYIVMFLNLVPLYYTKYIDWKYFPRLNKTLLGYVVLENSWEIKSVSAYLFSSNMISSFLAVPILSCILLVIYHLKSKWRMEIVNRVKTKDTMTSRERGLVKIVLASGVIFTITYSVSAVVILTCIIEPQFSYHGSLSNVFLISISISVLLDSVSSSIHIVLYLIMSSNFRTTFLELVHCFELSGI